MYHKSTKQGSTAVHYPHLESWPPLLWFHGSPRSMETERRLHDCGLRPVFSLVAHQPSGAPFLLAAVPDGPLLAIAPLASSAVKLVYFAVRGGEDPARWANRQRWRIVPGSLEMVDGGMWLAFGADGPAGGAA